MMNQQGIGPGRSLREHTLQKCADLVNAGQYDVAIALLRETLAKDPSNPVILHMLGTALAAVDHPREATRHLAFAAKLLPDDLEIPCSLAVAHRKLNQVREAHKALDLVLKKNPTFPRAVSLRALLYQSSGQAEKAMDLIESAIPEDETFSMVAMYGQLARDVGRYSDGIDLIEKTLEHPGLDKVKREALSFALGHLYDAEGEYDRAFACFERGNTMAGVQPEDNIDRLIQMHTPELHARVPSGDLDGSRAVFIVGMPRSGTTLTEQVLSSHPSAGGVGESPVINELVHKTPFDQLTQKESNAQGARYLAMLAEEYPEKKIVRVCDKMPENFLFLGNMNKILPGANYIHCMRDARDTCLSIYFQRFGARLQYARCLETCARQYLGYLRLMDHWRELLDITIYDSRYEELTSDPRTSVEGLLGHIGLGFDQACLEHHKNKKSVQTASIGQVRKPIYKSSRQRWKNYEKHLGPMLELLADV